MKHEGLSDFKHEIVFLKSSKQNLRLVEKEENSHMS